MQKSDPKSAFRTFCKKRLERLSKQSRYRSDKCIGAILYRLIRHSGARDVLLYVPMAHEYNSSDLIKRLRRDKIRVYVPVVKGESFDATPYRLPLKKKRFGIKEPSVSGRRFRKIDIAIVPVLGVDKAMRRVGFGKGMYDRFFARTGHKIDKVVFVSRRRCFSKESLTYAHDVKGDVYIAM